MRKLLFLLFALFVAQTSEAQTPFYGDSTNLEANASLIQFDSSISNIWQIGVPQKSFFGISNSPPYSIMTDTINPYPVNNQSRFTVELNDAGFIWDAEIGFWHKYESDTLTDGGYVELSVDSGLTWHNVATQNIIMAYSSTNFYSPTDTINGNIPAFSGSQNNWEYSSYIFEFIVPVIIPFNSDLKSSMGGTPGEVETSRVMFRFNFKSDSINTNKAGWIIDDITIREYDLGGGVHENEQANFDVKTFPNPIDEQGIIQVVPKNNEHDFTIDIYNPMGQLIISSQLDKNNQYIIHGNELQSGVYFYSVKAKNGTFKSGKLLIK